MFQQFERLPPDSILGLMAQYRADAAPLKVDLGVGVYRDATGATPVLECVRQAEGLLLAEQTTKAYVAPAGRAEFNEAVEALVLGPDHPVRRERRARTVQAPGGCGALRLGAELIHLAAPAATVHVSDPTWGNHVPLLGGCGLRLDRYPYYEAAARRVRFDAMLERLDRASQGDVVLLHACCHNPTGADLPPAQWDQVIELLERRRLVPYLDLAYQGFGVDLERDAHGVRRVLARLPEALVAISFSKNLGLYRERVGALIVVSESPDRAEAVNSHVLKIARGIYSMPPDHGAAVAARVLTDAKLKAGWLTELEAMRVRIASMRTLLAAELRTATGGAGFDFIAGQHGMFSLLGITGEAVARLRERHHIYMTADSRVNLAGITPENARYVAAAVAAEHSGSA